MNKQAFRNRMQQLKQYREQNPGKTYLDWKTYADGGINIDNEDSRTDHPTEKPNISSEPIRRRYTINQENPDVSYEKYDRDGDGKLSSKERYERQKIERRYEDWRNLLKGLNNTFGTAAAVSSMIGGGGWALTRLLSRNKPTALGQTLAPLVLPANAADNIGDISSFIEDPSVSKALEIGIGIGLGKWKDFGSTARQAAELGSQILNVV